MSKGGINRSDSTNKLSETDVIKMLDFLIDNIFVTFGDRHFQQIIGIPIGTNCAILDDFFLYSFEVDFIKKHLRKNKKKLALSLNFTFRYIEDVLLLNHSKFGDYVERIYPIKLEIKITTDTVKSTSYLDLHLEIDNEGRLRTKRFRQKR